MPTTDVADITACLDSECPSRRWCARYVSQVRGQAYFDKATREPDSTDCRYFMKLERYNTTEGSSLNDVKPAGNQG